MDANGHPGEHRSDPPPPRGEAHELVVDTVFPHLSLDEAMIIQMPTYRDEPKPRPRGTETSQDG
jgi:hypothetical protein